MSCKDEPPWSSQGWAVPGWLWRGCHRVCSGKGRAGFPCGLAGWCSSRQSSGGVVGAAPLPCCCLFKRGALLRVGAEMCHCAWPPSGIFFAKLLLLQRLL